MLMVSDSYQFASNSLRQRLRWQVAAKALKIDWRFSAACCLLLFLLSSSLFFSFKSEHIQTIGFSICRVLVCAFCGIISNGGSVINLISLSLSLHRQLQISTSKVKIAGFIATTNSKKTVKTTINRLRTFVSCPDRLIQLSHAENIAKMLLPVALIFIFFFSYFVIETHRES